MIAYHYCGADTFLKILSTRTLWATHFEYLNDAGEIRRGIEVAKVETKALLDGAKAYLRRHYFDQVLEQLGEKVSRQIFLVCFSEVGDLLSQWRAYADDARGFAIGFDFQRLTKQSAPTGQQFSGRVLYDESSFRNAVRNYLMEHAPTESSHSDPDGESFASANANNHSWGILSLAARFKHHGFEEEREARIACVCNLPIGWRSVESVPISEIKGPIFLSSFDRLDEELPSLRKFRASSRGIVPYLEWKFDANDITEIRVGPRSNTEQQLSAIRMFLESTGYRHLIDKVISSDATYQ